MKPHASRGPLRRGPEIGIAPADSPSRWLLGLCLVLVALGLVVAASASATSSPR